MIPAPSRSAIDDALEALETLVDAPSWSRAPRDLEQCADLVAGLFEPLADEVEHIPLDDLSEVTDAGEMLHEQLGPAVRARRRSDAERRVLLIGHYDTVFAPGTPFSGVTRDGDRWSGPGVVDAKGGLVVARLALELAEAAGIDVGWEVLVVPDEEIGSPGSIGVLEASAREADLGLGYEPAMPDGSLAGARPGSANLTHVVRGRAAHAGRELDQGANAILAAGRLAATIDALNEDPDVLANPGVIAGGTATNIVPDLAVLRSNIRPRTEEAAARVQARLDEALNAISVDGITVETHGGLTRPPKEMSADYRRLLDEVVAVAGRLGMDVAWEDTGGVCDGNVLAGAGLVNVDNLGPVGGDLHRTTEYLDTSSVGPRARLSAELIRRFDRGAA